MPAEDAGEVLVTFDDVAIYFSLDEWAMLTAWQRDLYREVMEDNFELVVSLGSRRPPKPGLLCKLEQGREPYASDLPGWEDEAALGAPLSAAWSPNVPEPALKEEFGGPWSPLASLESSDLGVGVCPIEACPSWTESKPPALGSTAVRGPWEREGGGGSLGEASPDQLLLQICECGRSFEDVESLQDHRVLHKEEGGPFVCRACGKSFRYRLNLLAHKKHRGKKRHACASCGLQFCLKGDMLRHRAGHTATGLHPSLRHKGRPLTPKAERGGDGAHGCPSCGTAFGSEAQLWGQQLSHPEEKKPLFCTKCGESVGWKESLQVHQRGHACHVCGKTFSRHGNLLAHQRLHTGELLFPCTHCKRSFPSKVSLVAHSRQHRQEKPWACPQCGRGFQFRYKLLEHQASHSSKEGH